MKDLKGIKGKYYIASLIEEGEHEHQDFKFAVSDSRKIARSISAFANNDGGRLLIGVKDNGVVAGVRNEEDVYVVEQAAEMHCVPPQQIRVTAFKAADGLTVMRVEIDRSQSRPVMVKEADGSMKAYFRVRDENICITPLMARAWRQASCSEGTLVRIDERGHRLLDMASTPGGVSVEEFMYEAHVSRVTAEDIVVTLHSMGLVDFRHSGHEFRLFTI
ncbi:MAG: ATP-binding protein [Duncaniella sp.]|nr:ATP-binding protein [Duncaniella sp.]MDE6465708.1 ATP-binding protein [Duncaniella sp.]MDE6572314.1 ATP-binding protein [Duncaniella sp.]